MSAFVAASAVQTTTAFAAGVARRARLSLRAPVRAAVGAWIAVGALATAGVPAVASAHGALRRSQPAANARLSAAPRELRLTFTEVVELPVARLTLLGPGGDAVALAPLALAPDSAQVLVSAVRGSLVAGTYTVAWQVAGRDGHPVRGRYTFTLLPSATGLAPTRAGAGAGASVVTPPAAPAADPETPAAGEAGASVTAPGQPTPPGAHHPAATVPASDDFGAESPAYVAVRWATYVALMLVLGAAAFRVAVLGPLRRAGGPDGAPFAAEAARRAATVGLWSAAGLAAAALARLAAQSVAMHGAADALAPAMVGTMLSQTVWGWGWLLQVGAALVAAAAFAAARRGKGAGWVVAALAALGLAFTPALSGHAAAAARLTTLAVLSDGLHVLGAGGWLGSLVVVLAAGVPAALALGAERRGAAVAALVNAFSPTALAFAGLTAGTGLFAGWLHVGRLAALWETGYGQTLLVKLAVLSLLAGTGAYNWRRVRPALGDDTGTARIRRSAAAELAVGALVLLVTAVLVATPTPVDDDAGAAQHASMAALPE